MHCFDFHRHHHMAACFDHRLHKSVDPSINKDIYIYFNRDSNHKLYLHGGLGRVFSGICLLWREDILDDKQIS